MKYWKCVDNRKIGEKKKQPEGVVFLSAELFLADI